MRKQLLGIPWDAFEELVARLLSEMGFEEIEITEKANDGGIDVRGTLLVGDVIRTRMAVQVTRWKRNVQAPVVQQVVLLVENGIGVERRSHDLIELEDEDASVT